MFEYVCRIIGSLRMFQKIKTTAYPPSKPLLVFDGNCGFCKYWIIRWKVHSAKRINYQPFQEVHSEFPDIPLEEFKKASRLIEVDGSVYSGPDSAFRSYYISNRKKYLHRWYTSIPLFTWFADQGYHFIATHRPFMFKISKFFFGKSPMQLLWHRVILVSAGILIFLLLLVRIIT